MASEKRLIDANARIEGIKNAQCTGCESYGGVRCRACWVDDAIGLIDDAPTVDAVEVVHGLWEKSEYIGFVRCDKCKDVYIDKSWLMDGKWNYCPNCGAKMDGERKDNERKAD